MARAYRAGRQRQRSAEEGVRKEGLLFSDPRAPQSILHLLGVQPGFFTQSGATYFRKIRGLRGERFCPESLSHAFGARAEVTAFLAGAGQAWPSEL